MIWGNPRWQRLLMWAMRWKSPSLQIIPTFREVWTGRVYRDVLGDAFESGWNSGVEQGLREMREIREAHDRSSDSSGRDVDHVFRRPRNGS